MCDTRYAYVEFAEASSVTNAMVLNESLFRNRQLSVRASASFSSSCKAYPLPCHADDYRSLRNELTSQYGSEMGQEVEVAEGEVIGADISQEVDTHHTVAVEGKLIVPQSDLPDADALKIVYLQRQGSRTLVVEF
jgi:hypothetical protein